MQNKDNKYLPAPTSTTLPIEAQNELVMAAKGDISHAEKITREEKIDRAIKKVRAAYPKFFNPEPIVELTG